MIVESPAKARKIGGYLGDDYIVEASIGHIRDLPQRAADIPKEVKKFAWSREGVDIENGFAPLYVINPDKRQKVQELKDLLKESEELILATDEDREGEAIAWHLMEILKPKVPVKRMVFNEITKEAILKAVNETRDIDERLVDAQETRRVLDRLFGYRLSPVLWKKVMPRISAGRVQSVATRLIVERERESSLRKPTRTSQPALSLLMISVWPQQTILTRTVLSKKRTPQVSCYSTKQMQRN
ncbi:MAG: hypothetical protein RIT18_1194 [Actinomycetota bacterium]